MKEAEERKKEILDIAEQLFIEKGFDNTSTNDILREIGIARGTLYYYFKSKEEILDAVIDRITNQLVEKSKEIFDQKSKQKKLTAFIYNLERLLHIEQGSIHELILSCHK